MILVFGLMMGSTAEATTSGCSGFFWQGENTNSNNNEAIYGYLTDPSDSSLPGDTSNPRAGGGFKCYRGLFSSRSWLWLPV
jgi:hypothetical protein